MTITADNPRVTVVIRHPYGTPGPCIHCGQPIDTQEDYLALHAGTTDHPTLIAVAHTETYNDRDDDWDDSCTQALRQCWEQLLSEAGAGTLQAGRDAGGPRSYLNDEPLHAGTPLQILDNDGVWHRGHYEYDITATGCSPKLCLTLGGWASPEGALTIPPGTAARLPEGPRLH